MARKNIFVGALRGALSLLTNLFRLVTRWGITYKSLACIYNFHTFSITFFSANTSTAQGTSSSSMTQGFILEEC